MNQRSNVIITSNIKDIISPKSVNFSTTIFKRTPYDEQKAPSIEDKQFLDIMQREVHINEEGNLELPLPFMQDPKKLPNNRQSALNRFYNLQNQLQGKPQMMEEYFQFMKKIMERAHPSSFPENEIDADNAWYLPHFGVYHPKKQQIRVVFDSSAKYNGVSLNDALLQGPDQMNSLLGILLRFRREQTAVMGDVEQMFHSFHVNKEHRDYLRFFWFKDNDPTKPVIQYRMNVHLFGNVSSPAIATFGLRKIAEDGVSTYGEDVKEFIDKNFYVDDGLTSAPDAKKAISLVNRTRDLLATRNVNFHKIVSNDKEVMTALPNEVRAKDLQSLDFNQDTLPTQRSLGVKWSLEADAFTFEVDLKEKPFSRREYWRSSTQYTIHSVYSHQFP
ncbi:uncharacterized protein [Ptychodera flava]|uniref:uncharacterized protein n=1 Tax=Ptychodera flava TaxID=63121 RepID=UPI00396A8C2F